MLNYISKGTGGKQLIFIHGNSQSLHYWDKVIDCIASPDEYTLIAIDLPGHGQSFRSRNPIEDYSLKGFAHHLKRTLEQLEASNYILVGNSLGCNVIGELEAIGSGCKGILFSGSTAIGKGLTVEAILQPNPNAVICFAEEFTDEQLNLLINDSAYLLTADTKGLVRETYKLTDPAVRSGIASCVGKQDYSDELQNIEASHLPIALVFGKEEKLVKTDHLNNLTFKKWKDQVILIEDSGHCCQLDQPERLAEIVKEFAKDCFR